MLSLEGKFSTLLSRLPELRPERLARWTLILLVVALGYSLAQLTWMLWPGGKAFAPPMRAAQAVQRPGPQAHTGLREVIGLHLFGEAGADKPAAAPVVAPETRLSLKLKGLVATDEQKEALAIIASGNGEDQYYRVGDSVPGGASIHEIRADRVILERGGRFETLTLPKETVSDGAVETSVARPGGPGSRGVERPSPLANKLRDYRDRLVENPQSIMELARIEPVTEEGRLKGYRVQPSKDRLLFRGLGLRPGDIVTSVNGIPLDDPARMGELFSQLRGATAFDVEVERGGRRQSLAVSLE